MSIESNHQSPEFQEKKYFFFQNFMLKHRDVIHTYIDYGLLNESGYRSYRNIAKHQILFGEVAETITELLGWPEDKIKSLTDLGLTHDIDKRRRLEKDSISHILFAELNRNERPLLATGTNFREFNAWGTEEYILRYIDSSIGEDKNAKGYGQWKGPRDPKHLPNVIIEPWRERIGAFKRDKFEEGQLGIPIYDKTTWEKLEEVMEVIENHLFKSIIEKNAKLREKYKDPSQLTELIEEHIHSKILRQKI